MIMIIILLVVGAMILGGGLYYLFKEKGDQEAQKIYIITTIAGAAILAGTILKIAISGL